MQIPGKKKLHKTEKNSEFRRMKLCFVFPRLTGPYGSERHLANLANCLAERGYDVTIYVHRLDVAWRAKLSNKIHVIETGFINTKSHELAALLDLLLMPNLAIRVKGSYDLILGMKWQSALGVFLAKKFHKRYGGTPTIYHCTEPSPRFIYDLREDTLSEASGLKRFLIMLITPIIEYVDKYTVKKFDVIIANSDQTAQEIRRIYARDSQIIYPGIEIERFKRYKKKEAKRKMKISPDTTVFLSISKLHHRKRIDKALEIYEEYSKNIEKAILFVVGEGPEEENLRHLAKRMQLKNVRFVGRVSDDDIPLYYSAADFFIFTSKDEPFGLAVLEAKFSGCTILGTTSSYPVLSWEESTERAVKVYQTISVGCHNSAKLKN